MLCLGDILIQECFAQPMSGVCNEHIDPPAPKRSDQLVDSGRGGKIGQDRLDTHAEFVTGGDDFVQRFVRCHQQIVTLSRTEKGKLKTYPARSAGNDCQGT
jgi:hypothetical protein